MNEAKVKYVPDEPTAQYHTPVVVAAEETERQWKAEHDREVRRELWRKCVLACLSDSSQSALSNCGVADLVLQEYDERIADGRL